MLLNESSLESIHRFCTGNRALLEQSSSAGCFCCGETFAPSDIREWHRTGNAATSANASETATCPHCGQEAVLPSAAPVMLTPRQLAAIKSFWFSSRPQSAGDH